MEKWCAVFTPIDNRQAAIDLGGGFSFSFVAFATPEAPDSNGEWPSGPSEIWNFAMGPIDEQYFGAYKAAAEANPALYKFVEAPSGVAGVLEAVQMYRWFPPEE